MTQYHILLFCDLLLNRHTARWNLFLLYNKEVEKFNSDIIYVSVLQ